MADKTDTSENGSGAAGEGFDELAALGISLPFGGSLIVVAARDG